MQRDSDAEVPAFALVKGVGNEAAGAFVHNVFCDNFNHAIVLFTIEVFARIQDDELAFKILGQVYKSGCNWLN